MGAPEEVADAVVFLASPRASWIQACAWPWMAVAQRGTSDRRVTKYRSIVISRYQYRQPGCAFVKESEMVRSLRCALARRGFLARVSWQCANARSGGGGRRAKSGVPVEPNLRSDSEKLMDVTGQSAVSTQIASTSPMRSERLKQTQKAVPPW